VEAPVIKIEKWMVGEDPAIHIYHMEITAYKAVWTETWGSRELLNTFLRGFRAGYQIMGVYIPDPDIPTEAKPWPVK